MIASHGFHIGREDAAPATTTEWHGKKRIPNIYLIIKNQRDQVHY
jgi:hypothetical protein